MQLCFIMKSVQKAYLSLILANVLYGINYIVIKIVMPDYINPFALTFIRIIPSAILLWLFSCFFVSERYEKPKYKLLFLSAFFGVFLNQFLFIAGLNFTSPIDASIIITSNPIIVLLVALIYRYEKLPWLKLTGLVLGFIGALLLVSNKGVFSFSKQHFWGNLLLFINALSFAFYMHITRPLMKQYEGFFVLKWTFLFGALLYAPFGIWGFLKTTWNTIPFSAYMALLYIVIFTTIITYFLMNYGLKYLSSTTVGMFLYIQPLVATSLSIIYGIDQITLVHIIAASLVFLGLFLVNKSK